MQIITLDIDDCIVDTNGTAEKIAQRHGETLDYSDYNYINRCSPPCAKEISDFLFIGDASCDPNLVKLTSDRAPEYIKLLSQIFNVYYVTARDPNKFEPTIKYFEHYKVNIPRNNLITTGAGVDKVEILIKLKTIFHMDDSPTTIQKCFDKNINFCMVSNPQTGYNIPMRKTVGDRWVNNIDEFWLRKHEFLPISKANTK